MNRSITPSGSEHGDSSVKTKRRRRNSSDGNNNQVWGPQASKDHIQRGIELRAMSDEELAKLSTEDQERARILKERSERKKARKQKQIEFKSQYLRKVK